MFFALKSMLLVCLHRCGSDYFQNIEIAQNITKLRVVAHSIIFTTNPNLNVNLCIMKTNVLVIKFIYAFELIIRNNTTHNNYIKLIFRISNIDYNR